MKEVLILCTGWHGDYWESRRTVSYSKKSVEPVRHLKNALPVAGVGVYIKWRERDYSSQPPCFLMVKNIGENEKGELQLDLQFVSKIEGTTSREFLKEIGGFQDLFFSIPKEKVLDAFRKIGVKPPLEWERLLEEKPKPSWLDWVGKRFHDILQPISNTEYEDRVADIFNALGFEVEQIGYRREGEYPDGILYSKDFAIVYDCKNRSNYFIDARDKRAMIKYVQYAKRRIEEQRGITRVYFALVAHSYGNVEGVGDIEKEASTKGFLFTSEALLHLLFKKMYLGRLFLLSDFEELISSQVITVENIEKVYGR
ncbi:MAG: hypothetical protein QW797_09280 [Thermoproteota archaeon]